MSAKNKERALELHREAARSINSLEFALRFWERESAPAELLLTIPFAYKRRLDELFVGSTHQHKTSLCYKARHWSVARKRLV